MLKKDAKIGEYILIEKVGSGAFGDVWKAEKRTILDSNYFALKFFRPKDDRIDLEKIGKEIQVWKKLKGLPHIISVIELDKFDDYVYVVSDFADGGSLEKYLESVGEQPLPETEAVKITLHILTGLENLHEKGIIHRDLKPDNILIMNGKCCLADFGVSREMKSQSKATGTAGTIEYMPPEAFENKFSAQTDIWAVGVILQRLLTGSLPFPQDNQAALVGAIVMFEPVKMPEIVHEGLREIVNKCLQKEPQKRFVDVAEMQRALRNPQGFLEYLKPQVIPSDDEKITQSLKQTAKTEFLTIPIQGNDQKTQPQPTEDWREVERKGQAEIAENQQQEANRQQAELDRIQRNLQAKPPKKSSPNYVDWAVGGIGAVLILLLALVALKGLIPVITDNKTDNKNTSNTSTNSTTIKNSIGMELVKIPAGTFTMGSPANEKDRSDDEKQHQVTISKDFYLGKYEVTQAQWTAVMGNNPSNFKGENLPVETVSWEDAQEFIKKLNAKGEGIYRLPTEAEWEYAARGGTTGAYYGNVNDIGWFTDNSGGKTHPVGQKQANGFGLYDTSGNVWEWCSDWYGEYPSGSLTDPTGATSGSIRVNRRCD